ncbi:MULTISPECIES: hypothetical protein [Streptosporangium]|uniref:Uncharacterized protein n=1 Tax=Streptosporangium jomthongense TaxID=1193683 RepID=A0ABV8F966_9ACTN
MRRSAHLIAALGAAPTPPPATTAFGGGQVVENPSGCADAYPRPLVPRDETNEYALVHGGPHRTGQAVAVVQPGGRAAREFGTGVHVS